ncbi:FHA domain-containing protein [Phyllobacterium sp. CCNWLW109]|uniref:SctD/MshK family protein n=1 Tax=Phyllobacterium sp. CCNWLW109 TaxID=3127479 RepID=UPI003078039A
MGSIVRFQEPKPALLLRVTAGVHDGVLLPLEGNAYRLGSAADCDLTLSDRDVGAHHMTLQLQGSNVLIEAIDGDVVIDDDTLVPAGHGVRSPLPFEFQIGGATIELSSPVPEGDALRKMPRASWIAIGGGALTLLTIAAVQAGVGDFLGSNNAAVAHLSAKHGQVIESVHAPAADEPVAASLKTRLAENGLSGLKVDADGTRLTVSGELTADENKAWANIQNWFDRTYGGTYVLTSMVGAMAPKVQPKFNLQAVWFGDAPYAISSDGTRLYKGAALEDGWIIKDIRDGRLTAARQGEEFVLTF